MLRCFSSRYSVFIEKCVYCMLKSFNLSMPELNLKKKE